MKPLTATTSTVVEKDFTERYGGWILSACLHVILFATLLMVRQQRAPLPSEIYSQTLRVNLAAPDDAGAALAAPAPASVPGAEAPVAAPGIVVRQAEQLGKLAPPAPLLTAEDAAAEDSAPAGNSLSAALRPVATFMAPAVPQLQPAAELANAVAGPGGGGEGAPNPNAGGSTEPGPGSPDGTYAAGTRSRRGGGTGTGEGSEGGNSGSAAVGSRIQLARTDLIAQKTLFAPKDLFAARGASEGAIRTLEIGGVDGDTAKEVLDRYGIKILNSPPGSPLAMLPASDAGQGRFVNRFSSGALGIFQFSAAAAGRMTQLEEEALHQNGFDPAKTRIVRVVFGIVGTRDRHDLGVIKIDTEPLRLPGGPKSSQLPVASSQ